MRFLHTADWHIGKRLNGFDLLADQMAMFKQIEEVAKAEKVDAIVIAGDLFVPFQVKRRFKNCGRC